VDTFRPPGDETEYENVSTGRLPTPAVTKALVGEAHARYRSADDGAISTVYPALARVPRDLFGVCVVGTSGNIYAAGDADYEFTITSASKPFVFALVCQALGADGAHAKLGVNNTGLPFKSLSAIENSPDGRTNPMVNPGAIATTSLVPGTTEKGRWRFIQDGLSKFAGRALSINNEVYASASDSNFETGVLSSCCGTTNACIVTHSRPPTCTRANAH
jgi:glutaminase